MKKLNKKLIIGLILILLVLLPVIFCLIHSPYDVNAIDSAVMLKAPSLMHIFGTDNFGRDIFCRAMSGAAVTFGVALITVLAGALIGTLVGAVTAYFGGPVDEILMRINDGLASFPSILLALVAVSVLDAGTLNICIALGIVFIPSFARIMRAEFLKEKGKDYVLQAKLMGAGDLRIMFLHIFPNTLKILGSTALVGLNNAVLAEAGLSYLGLGVQPPDPSLGRMLSEAQVYVFSAPWYAVSTCLVMITAMLGISLVGSSIGVSGVSLWKVKRELEKARKAGNSEKETAVRPQKCCMEGEDGTDGLPVAGETPGAAAASGTDSLLRVEDMSVAYIDEDAIDTVINGLSFELKKGEILGIVGESGSGKSLTSLAVMGILPRKACITKGEIFYKGKPLSFADPEEYRRLRAGHLAMIFQEPMTSLDPTMKIGAQLQEVLDIGRQDGAWSRVADGKADGSMDGRQDDRTDDGMDGKADGSMDGRPDREPDAGPADRSGKPAGRADDRSRIYEALQEVGLNDTERICGSYPHELSGGMRQRVMIAMAVLEGAEVIIADEPTTALDAEISDKIIDLFREINAKHGTSVILISHDLRVIGRICSRALVMKDGRLEEELEIKQKVKSDEELSTGRDSAMAFAEPRTEYGKRLLQAAFADRIYRSSAPVHAGNADGEPLNAGAGDTASFNAADGNAGAGDLILELQDFSVSYPEYHGAFRRRSMRRVNSNINMKIRRGETFGLVGPSGCGKSTLVKAIAGLQKYTEGRMILNCSGVGMVFQDPAGSLNPAYRVSRLLEEPLKLQGRCSRRNAGRTADAAESKIKDSMRSITHSRQQSRQEICSILQAVGLDESYLKRRISELSGGQKQRISIALSLLSKQELIILDEPLSALDVTLQEQVLELLMELKKSYGLTYILISHDARLIERSCDSVYRF